MPRAIVLGIPKQQSRRLSAELRKSGVVVRANWTVMFTYSAKDDIVSLTDSVIAQALELAGDKPAANLLAFRPRTQEQQKALLAATRPYFRLRWADNARLQLIPHGVAQFIDYLAAELAIEEQWDADVKPIDIRSPLILPQSSFVVQRSREQLWSIASEAANPHQIVGAKSAMAAFRESYWQTIQSGQGVWVDDVGNAFDHTGPRHGVAPHPRCWKYSFAIPLGFHFDVTALSGRSFSVMDCFGRSKNGAKGGHVNIDPHGVTI